MAPREANNPFADQFLTIEYDATAMILPHDTGPAPAQANLNIMNMGTTTDMDVVDIPLPNAPANTNGNTNTNNDDADDQGIHGAQAATAQTPIEALFQSLGQNAQTEGQVIPAASSGENSLPASVQLNSNTRRSRSILASTGSDIIQDIDPLAIDISDSDEQDAWNLVDAAIASASENCTVTTGPSPSRHTSRTVPSLPSPNLVGSASRRSLIVTPVPGEIEQNSTLFSHLALPPHPSRGHSISSNLHRRRTSLLDLDQDPSLSGSDDEDDMPGLDTTVDNSTTTSGSEISSLAGTPHRISDQQMLMDSPNLSTEPNTNNRALGGLRFSPVRRMLHGETNIFQGFGSATTNINVVADSDHNSSGSSFTTPNARPLTSNFSNGSTPPIPEALSSLRRGFSSSTARSSSITSLGSTSRSIHWNSAFDSGNSAIFDSDTSSQLNSPASDSNTDSASNGPQQVNLSFGPNTTVSDLKYFAERGCIVPLLRALDTPRLKSLGTRMLADYAKMPNRRVAVASNKRILEFCCRTMLEMPTSENMGTEWPAREYAVETIRSLTATEDSDGFLMACKGLLQALSVVARGGPFVGYEYIANGHCQVTPNMGLVSGKARLHACIAIMNLSCGKANKVEIAAITEVLEAMRDVMMAKPENFSPATSSPIISSSNSSNVTPKNVAAEARLKAATCVKNLSNADRNDAALLNAEGLIEALAHVATDTCAGEKGATNCTTNSCLALMNLSISKANKHKVFSTKGVMDALMTVLELTSPKFKHRSNANNEARIKACSALSNLAIGYENKIPMFNYPGFVASILQVIETDSGEARTKACSILWSFAAEMKNQVPVVQRGDILPTLVRVAEEDHSTEARFKCVAALTLLAESLDNALPLLESGALHPLMDILHDAGADPTQWKGQTASWCVGFLMNMSQSDEAAPYLREAGVVELLAPLLTLDHYQSLKAAMAVTFVCRYDEGDETYDLLRKTENVIPKIISLLHNTLAGMGGNGYKYGVFTLRSSVGCISSLASGPEFMKERISTKDVFDSLLRVVNDFCVDGGTDGAIVGGGRDDTHSATLAIRALHSLTEYLIPIPGSSSLPLGSVMDSALMTALDSFGSCTHPSVLDKSRDLAKDAFHRIQSSLDLNSCPEDSDSGSEGYMTRQRNPHIFIENSIVASLVQGCCIGPSLHAGFEDGFFPSMIRTTSHNEVTIDGADEHLSHSSESSNSQDVVRTFLLTDSRTGRRFAVPADPSGGRAFNDGRLWCYRRGRFSKPGEMPDPDYQWNDDLQTAYMSALNTQQEASPSPSQSSLSSNTQAPSQVPSQRGAVYLGNS